MIALQRHATLQTLRIEKVTGVDGQGAPQYGSPVDVKAFVVVGSQVTRNQNGQDVAINGMAWVDAAQPLLPGYADRLTFADGSKGIVMSVETGNNLQRGTVDHVKVSTREE